ncbi:hypothetical protein D3C81_1863020 [compost metagenome]
MQERIGLAALGRVVARQRAFGIGQQRLVFGMLVDPVDGHHFERGEDIARHPLLPRFAEEPADFFS